MWTRDAGPGCIRQPAIAVALVVAIASACGSTSQQPVRTEPPRSANAEPVPGAGAPGGSSSASASPTPAAPPAEAVNADLPAYTLENVLATHPIVCNDGDCTIDGSGPDEPPLASSEDGGATTPPGLAWIEVIQPGATVRIPRSGDVDVFGVVIAGRAALAMIESHAAPTVALPWSAFMLPEAGATIRAAGTAAVAIAFAVIDNDPVHPAPAAPRTRPRGGYVIRQLSDVPDLAWGGGAYHARIVFQSPDSRGASLQLLVMSPHAAVAEHTHPDAWEFLLAIAASGSLHVPEQPLPSRPQGARIPAHDRTMVPGAVAYVPIGVAHGWQPDGTTPLVAMQLYTPPGPEQRFRTLAQQATH